MRLVLEVDRGLFELAEPFYKALLVRVDQNIRNRRVLEQRFDRAKANHLIDEILYESLQLALVERNLLVPNVLGNVRTQFLNQLRPRHPLKSCEVELVDDLGVKLKFLVEQRRALS